MSAALAPIAAALLDAFAPLDRALHDPHAFRVLLRNLGWEKEIEDDVLAGPPLADLAAACAELLSSGATIADALADGSQDNDALFEELVDVIGGLRDLVAGLDGLDTAALPPELRDPDLWAGLALDLPEYLTVRYLERHQPVLYGLLRLAGVVEDDEQALEARTAASPTCAGGSSGTTWSRSSAAPPSTSRRSTTGTTAGRSTTRACWTSWRGSPATRGRSLRAPRAAPDARRRVLRLEPAAGRRARGGAADRRARRSTARTPSRACWSRPSRGRRAARSTACTSPT